METTGGQRSAAPSATPPSPDSPLACEERTGLSRRLCGAARRLLSLAGRGGMSGVPF